MGLSDGGVMWSQTDLAADPTTPLYHGRSDAEALRADLETKYAAANGWPSGVRALVEATTPADVIESTVAELPVSWRWGEGDVTLLGDAAHAQVTLALTPNLTLTLTLTPTLTLTLTLALALISTLALTLTLTRSCPRSALASRRPSAISRSSCRRSIGTASRRRPSAGTSAAACPRAPRSRS